MHSTEEQIHQATRHPFIEHSPKRTHPRVQEVTMDLDQEIAYVPNCLTRWYAANTSIRHLWAVEERDSLMVVFITLEPTSDGDDALPVWFAKGHEWASELADLTRREVQLRLLGPSDMERPPGAAATATIAELSWRDPWIRA
ncbi:hypothetical protein [Peristeroidobacter soli]|uniref:hypothetical protein n=1 Tax=Peristeroidobacter soli TaxID=2497877 RepID=UPI00101D2B5C|nr:hypothetical protein [Peristeroidobacter soli]